ncbi:MAG TPA: hypothetical protein ENI23_07590 [bacterium]|nr:hypothetical protein [bacterium]
MDTFILVFLSILSTAGIGATVVTLLNRKELVKKLKDKKQIQLSEEEAIAKASARAKGILLDAQKEVLEKRASADEEAKKRLRGQEEAEKRLTKKQRY